MNIDIDHIHALIAQQPNIRGVEIADIIDCEPEQVDAALAPDIASGRIVATVVTAPNGRAVSVFEFAAQLGVADAGIVAGTPAAQPLPASPPPAALAVKKRGRRKSSVRQYAPPRPPAAEPAVSYPDQAIALIRTAAGTMNNEALRLALGLGLGTSPSSYLRAAIKDQRLARIGRDWVLGPNAAATPRYSPGVTAPRAIPAPTAAPAPAAFRCATWSDGVLELQRAGVTIAVLAPSEQALLAGLLVAHA